MQLSSVWQQASHTLDIRVLISNKVK